MKITTERPKKTITMEYEGAAIDLLKKLEIAQEEVLIIRNGKLVTEDEHVTDDDEIELLSVISGG